MTDTEAGGRGAGRIPITLACSECKARNYKTTRNAADVAPLGMKKFCKQCKRHTMHRETK
jgi:large subunit ribosomal protein L33